MIYRTVFVLVSQLGILLVFLWVRKWNFSINIYFLIIAILLGYGIYMPFIRGVKYMTEVSIGTSSFDMVLRYFYVLLSGILIAHFLTF